MSNETDLQSTELKHPISIIEAAKRRLLDRIAYHEKELNKARRELGRLPK